MTDLINRAYNSFDDFMMKSANVGVKAWNNTFGKTKADLASVLLDASSIAFCLGTVNVYCQNYGFCVNSIYSLIPPLSLTLSHVVQKTNRTIEEKELSAMEKGLKDSNVESFNFIRKGFTIPVLLIGTAVGFGATPIFPSAEFYGAGFAISAFGEYVMRTEYLPPKKSIFARAKDKLVEMVNEIRVPVPQPVPVKFQSYSRESGGLK